MERERARYWAAATGNVLLTAAAVVAIIGLLAIWQLALQVDERFGFGADDDAGLDDYILVLFGYVAALVTAVGIVGGTGLFFRWLAVDQAARMAEFEMLLDALGVPVEDGDDTNTEEPAPNA